MEEDARGTLGRFETKEEAKAACRSIGERSLDEQFTPVMTTIQLIAAYKFTGAAPFIIADDGRGVDCAAWNYASIRAAKMSGG